MNRFCIGFILAAMSVNLLAVELCFCPTPKDGLACGGKCEGQEAGAVILGAVDGTGGPASPEMKSPTASVIFSQPQVTKEAKIGELFKQIEGIMDNSSSEVDPAVNERLRELQGLVKEQGAM